MCNVLEKYNNIQKNKNLRNNQIIKSKFNNLIRFDVFYIFFNNYFAFNLFCYIIAYY
jgi:hypothetical protein